MHKNLTLIIHSSLFTIHYSLLVLSLLAMQRATMNE